MLIRHTPPASALSHAGVTYEADEHGTFDVPEEVGQVLIARAGFSQYIGGDETADDAPVPMDERVGELEAEIAQLKAATRITFDAEKAAEGLEAIKPKPHKAAAKKAASKAKDAEPKGE